MKLFGINAKKDFVLFCFQTTMLKLTHFLYHNAPGARVLLEGKTGKTKGGGLRARARSLINLRFRLGPKAPVAT